VGKKHSWSRFTAENLILGLASLAFLITVSGSILYSLELGKKFDHLDEDNIVFVIPVGASFSLIKEILLESGILKSSLFFSSASYLGKMTDRMQAGEYEVNAESSTRVLVRNLAVGNVRSLTVTLIEGWTFEKALSTIRSSEAIITSSVDFSVSGLGIGVKDYPTSTEGMLFPDTYQYSAGTTDYEIISRANARLKDVLSSEWDKKTNDLPWKTPYDALIIASIIEKESGLINEKAEIAGVFARRIEKGMRLQSDPTVIYGLGDEYDGSLTRADLRRDTEFNSYTRSGLPPSPISLAGRESIRAALKPLSGESLYFVADGLGGHVFTNTLNDHNREVKKFREMSAQ
jgi:UPF0755 protein